MTPSSEESGKHLFVAVIDNDSLFIKVSLIERPSLESLQMNFLFKGQF